MMMPIKSTLQSSSELAASITWSASKQTYFTIRFLVDRQRVSDAYRTYAYFRWVDDQLDQVLLEQSARIAFVETQKALMECLYRGETPLDLEPEERMLADLVASDREPNSGLQTYIHSMMAVMAFDAYRRGRLISQKELKDYTLWLSTAVTEAMHYFIGHDCQAPNIDTRYLAVTGAHIVHMLRDTLEDTSSGYINIPLEFLQTHTITACDVNSPAYRMWVNNRVQLARDCFKAGQSYLAQVGCLRCRLAGYAYTARFMAVLNAVERDNYQLRSSYSEIKRPAAGLRMFWTVLVLSLNKHHPKMLAHARSEA